MSIHNYSSWIISMDYKEIKFLPKYFVYFACPILQAISISPEDDSIRIQSLYIYVYIELHYLQDSWSERQTLVLTVTINGPVGIN